MEEVDGVVALAALIADPTRARFLAELRKGEALPATELATRAGVSTTAASVHLKRLQQAGAIAGERRGRHRFFSIANPSLIQVLDAMAAAAPPAAAKRRRTRPPALMGELKLARTCYDHLAGELGIALTEALQARGLLVAGENAYEITASGRSALTEFGIDLAALESRRRPLAKTCLDWTERRPHLAGALGGALAERMLQLGWIRRRPGTRAVLITAKGHRELAATFGLAVSPGAR
jgi:DNA-binding transcriptional ArsR family regulator